jgi:hypothetical protein
MKRFINVFFGLVLCLFFVACQKANPLEGIDIKSEHCVYYPDDNFYLVSGDLVLPSKNKGVALFWKSTNSYLVNGAGVVILGPEIMNVDLFCDAGGNDFLTFHLRLVSNLTGVEVLTNLLYGDEIFYFNEELDRLELSESTVFPTELNGFSFFWTSDNPSVLSDTGIVVRGDTDVIVNLSIITSDGLIVELPIFIPAIYNKNSWSFYLNGRHFKILFGGWIH